MTGYQIPICILVDLCPEEGILVASAEQMNIVKDDWDD